MPDCPRRVGWGQARFLQEIAPPVLEFSRYPEVPLALGSDQEVHAQWLRRVPNATIRPPLYCIHDGFRNDVRPDAVAPSDRALRRRHRSVVIRSDIAEGFEPE